MRPSGMNIKKQQPNTPFSSQIRILGKFTSSYKKSEEEDPKKLVCPYPSLNLSSYMGSYCPDGPNRPD